MQIFSTSIVELAVIAALISLFLDFTFREGNIFAGWLDFLADLHIPADAMDLEREDRFELVEWFWFKPLGGCVVCMNVWISFAICACFFQRLELNLGVNAVIETIAGALLMVLLSNFLVRFFQEKII